MIEFLEGDLVTVWRDVNSHRVEEQNFPKEIWFANMTTSVKIQKGSALVMRSPNARIHLERDIQDEYYSESPASVVYAPCGLAVVLNSDIVRY